MDFEDGTSKMGKRRPIELGGGRGDQWHASHIDGCPISGREFSPGIIIDKASFEAQAQHLDRCNSVRDSLKNPLGLANVQTEQGR
jgi:hypothetical protein